MLPTKAYCRLGGHNQTLGHHDEVDMMLIFMTENTIQRTVVVLGNNVQWVC